MVEASCVYFPFGNACESENSSCCSVAIGSVLDTDVDEACVVSGGVVGHVVGLVVFFAVCIVGFVIFEVLALL